MPLPLVLSVKCENWRMHDAESEAADAEFRFVRKKALNRDDHACQFCGFRALKWQEVHHRNDDHSDNRPQNLVTACMFCHACQHIGLAGRNEEAVLAYIPEIPQDRLHHIVRTVLVATRWAERVVAERRPRPEVVSGAKEIADVARSLFAKLRAREAAAQRLLGTSDPLELANVMLMMPDEVYARRAEFLAGIRLLPLGRRLQEREDKMPVIVDSWLEAGGPYCNILPSTWVGLLRSALG